MNVLTLARVLDVDQRGMRERPYQKTTICPTNERNARCDGCHIVLYHDTHDGTWQTRHGRDQELCSISKFIANSIGLFIFSRHIEVTAGSTVYTKISFKENRLQ